MVRRSRPAPSSSRTWAGWGGGVPGGAPRLLPPARVGLPPVHLEPHHEMDFTYEDPTICGARSAGRTTMQVGMPQVSFCISVRFRSRTLAQHTRQHIPGCLTRSRLLGKRLQHQRWPQQQRVEAGAHRAGRRGRPRAPAPRRRRRRSCPPSPGSSCPGPRRSWRGRLRWGPQGRAGRRRRPLRPPAAAAAALGKLQRGGQARPQKGLRKHCLWAPSATLWVATLG